MKHRIVEMCFVFRSVDNAHRYIIPGNTLYLYSNFAVQQLGGFNLIKMCNVCSIRSQHLPFCQDRL